MSHRSDAHSDNHADNEDRLIVTTDDYDWPDNNWGRLCAAIDNTLDGRWFWPIVVLSATSLIAVIVFIVFIAAFAGVVFADNQIATKAIKSCEQKAIEQSKYPSGAKIISTDVGELETLPNGNKTLPVEGEIDMPNVFGTPVRHTYSCDLMMILEDRTIINDEPLILPKN